MPFGLRLVLLILLFSTFCICALGATELRAGSQVQVVIEHDTSMRLGDVVRAKTVYPLYVDNELVLPAGTEFVGKVRALTPVSKSKRRSAKLGGDFTPLHEPRIVFDEMVVDGRRIGVTGETVGDGAEVVR